MSVIIQRVSQAPYMEGYILVTSQSYELDVTPIHVYRINYYHVKITDRQ